MNTSEIKPNKQWIEEVVGWTKNQEILRKSDKQHSNQKEHKPKEYKQPVGLFHNE